MSRDWEDTVIEIALHQIIYFLKYRFVALYPDQVKKISRQEFEGLLEEYSQDILPNVRPEYTRVARVSNRILKGNKDLRQIYDKTWTVTVVDQPIQNAFVLPSGNIFIFRGMLDLCENDDQLAVIIGHEMAHSILGHIAEKLTMASFVQVVMLVPMAVLWALMPNDGIAVVCDWFIDKVTDVLIHLPFSRDMELEADEVGLLLAAKACFDVREAPALWQLLEMMEEDPLAKDKDFEFLATHPVHSTRYERTLIESSDIMIIIHYCRYEQLYDQLSSALSLRFDCGCARLDPHSDPNMKLEEFRRFLLGAKIRSSSEASLSDKR